MVESHKSVEYYKCSTSTVSVLWILVVVVLLLLSPSLYSDVYAGVLEASPSAESSGSEAPPSSPDRLRLSGVFSSSPTRSPREPARRRREHEQPLKPTSCFLWRGWIPKKKKKTKTKKTWTTRPTHFLFPVGTWRTLWRWWTPQKKKIYLGADMTSCMEDLKWLKYK